MRLSLQIIDDNLQNYKRAIHMNSISNTYIDVIAPRLILTPIKEISSEYVYIMTQGCLELYDDASVFKNIICVGNSEKILLLVKEKQVNIIIIEESIEATDAYIKVVEIFEHFNIIDNKLLHSVYLEMPILECLNSASLFFNNPIILMDNAFTVIEYTTADNGVPIDDEVFSNIYKYGHSSANTVNLYEKSNNSVLHGNAKSAKFNTVYPDIYDSIHVNLFINNKRVARLLIPDTTSKLKTGHLYLAEYVAPIIASLLKRRNEKNSYQNNMAEQFIVNLINGEKYNYDKFAESISNYQKWDFNGNYYLVKVMWEDSKPLDVLNFIFNEIKKIFDNSLFITYDEYEIFIINLKDLNYIPDEIIKKFTNILSERKLFAGFSLRFDNIKSLKSQYIFASQALKIGMSLDSKSNLFYYSDYLFYDVINNIFNADIKFDIKDLCMREIVKIHEYDKNNSTDYLISLYNYIICERSLVKASKYLHIHRNSLVYRLDKISEYVKIDYNDPNIRNHIILSCNILFFLDNFDCSAT